MYASFAADVDHHSDDRLWRASQVCVARRKQRMEQIELVNTTLFIYTMFKLLLMTDHTYKFWEGTVSPAQALRIETELPHYVYTGTCMKEIQKPY